jgi:hypothetical protein
MPETGMVQVSLEAVMAVYPSRAYRLVRRREIIYIGEGGMSSDELSRSYMRATCKRRGQDAAQLRTGAERRPNGDY